MNTITYVNKQVVIREVLMFVGKGIIATVGIFAVLMIFGMYKSISDTVDEQSMALSTMMIANSTLRNERDNLQDERDALLKERNLLVTAVNKYDYAVMLQAEAIEKQDKAIKQYSQYTKAVEHQSFASWVRNQF